MPSLCLTRKTERKHKAQMHELVLLPAFEELLCCNADRWMDRHLLPAVQGPMHSSSLETSSELIQEPSPWWHGKQAFLLVNHKEHCNYFPAAQSDAAFN